MLFDVCLTTTLDIAREGYKKNHEKYLINITVLAIFYRVLNNFKL